MKRVFLSNGYEVNALCHEDLDIIDFHQVEKYLRSGLGEVVRNCAAYTAADKA